MKSCPTCQATYPGHFTVCPQDATRLVELGGWAEGAVVRGKYRVLSKIGQGGMGAVYKAEHVRFEELRALKVISPELASDPSFVKRFIHEAVITRKLHHPNAVLVEDVDEAEDGRPFIVMEFMQGRNLKDLTRQQGPLHAMTVCSIIKQAAAALGAAHALGMVHRDIKPDNIFLVEGQEGAQVKVLDFGIAKVKEASLDSAGGITVTKTGLIVGTPKYMSPEQAMGMRGDELDGRSDLYSLGVVMYEMLSGDPPFDADTTMKILMAHIHQPPPPIGAARPELQVPDGVAQVVMRLLAKKREDRPATAGQLISEIDRALVLPAAPLVLTQVVGPEDTGSVGSMNRRAESGARFETPSASPPGTAAVPPRGAHRPTAAETVMPSASAKAAQSGPELAAQQKAMRKFVRRRIFCLVLYALGLVVDTYDIAPGIVSNDQTVFVVLIFLLVGSLVSATVLLSKILARGAEAVRSYLGLRHFLLYLCFDMAAALSIVISSFAGMMFFDSPWPHNFAASMLPRGVYLLFVAPFTQRRLARRIIAGTRVQALPKPNTGR